LAFLPTEYPQKYKIRVKIKTIVLKNFGENKMKKIILASMLFFIVLSFQKSRSEDLTVGLTFLPIEFDIPGYPANCDGTCGHNMDLACAHVVIHIPWLPVTVINSGERIDLWVPSASSTTLAGIGYKNAKLARDWETSNNTTFQFESDASTIVYTTYQNWLNRNNSNTGE
jgi:hypothetical protein